MEAQGKYQPQTDLTTIGREGEILRSRIGQPAPLVPSLGDVGHGRPQRMRPNNEATRDIRTGSKKTTDAVYLSEIPDAAGSNSGGSKGATLLGIQLHQRLQSTFRLGNQNKIGGHIAPRPFPLRPRPFPLYGWFR